MNNITLESLKEIGPGNNFGIPSEEGLSVKIVKFWQSAEDVQN